MIEARLFNLCKGFPVDWMTTLAVDPEDRRDLLHRCQLGTVLEDMSAHLIVSRVHHDVHQSGVTYVPPWQRGRYPPRSAERYRTMRRGSRDSLSTR